MQRTGADALRPTADGDRRGAVWIPLALFLVALVPRAVGLNWGYHHPDENITMAAKALSGQLVPHHHYYPPLLNYVDAVGFAILYAVGWLLPAWRSVDDFRAQYYADPLPFFLVARLIAAAFGAAIAPLFYLTARTVGLPRAPALLTAVLAICLPAGVYFSHISKCDIAMATAALFFVWVLLEKLHAPAAPKWDYLLGASITLAVSFKHSAVFLIAPFLLGALVFLRGMIPLRGLFRSALRVFGVCFLLWPILNVGIVLDAQNFLEYQQVQSKIALRDDGLVPALAIWFSIHSDSLSGISLPAVLIWLTIPLLVAGKLLQRVDRRQMVLLWGAVVVSSLLLLHLIGSRHVIGLWLPYMTLIFLTVAIAIGDLLCAPERWRKAVGWGAAICIFASSAHGSVAILRQALAVPMAEQIGDFLASYVADGEARIMAPDKLSLPVSRQALDDIDARDERLAAKYGVVLPRRAGEGRRASEAGRTYYVIPIPFAIGGLEAYREDEMDIIKPYAWPIQDEEWSLAYWRERGIDIFVLSAPEAFLRSDVDAYRRTFREIQTICRRVAAFSPAKPLFLEDPVAIYDCRGR